jgi:hypothetical protein
MKEDRMGSVLNHHLKGTYSCIRNSLSTYEKPQGRIVIFQLIGLMGNAFWPITQPAKAGMTPLPFARAKEFASRKIR